MRLLRPIDRWIRLTKRWGEVLPDRRDSYRNTQMLENLLRDNMDDLAGHKNFK